MSVFESFILGLVQGFGEFLPISSSGHLVLAQRIFGIESAGIALEVLLHLGTLLAVFIIYWKDIWDLIRHPFKSYAPMLVVATIPAIIATLLLEDYFDAIFGGNFLGISFIITSLILYFSSVLRDRVVQKHKMVKWPDAITMGIMQAVAIVPGISRSGSTIAGGLARGLSKEEAAKFSFLMSIPAILGSVVLSIKDMLDPAFFTGESTFPLLIGVATSAIAGVLAIKWLLSVLKNKGLNGFALYTLVLGLIVMVDQYLTHIVF